MNRKKLCVCIPTYNRCDAVKRVLDTELALFEKYEIDMMICDSSNHQDIKLLVDEYIQKGSECLFYKKYDSSIPSNEKVFRIFQWAAASEYSFIWLIHDHTVCNEDAVKYLMQELDKKQDFYLLNMQAGSYASEKFKSMNEFLLKGAWRLNSFGASVINTQTFLKGVNWDRIRQKYGGAKTLNYSHIGFYFERAAEMEEINACQVFFERKDFLDFYRTREISWSKDTLRICLECWGEVISRLPEVYTNKIEVMRTQDKWFLSKYSLLIYRKEKRYDFQTFLKYRKWIKKIYPQDYVRDFLISFLPVGFSFRIYTGDLAARISDTKRTGGEVYIFGAGRHAAECAVFFGECGMVFDGFVVTSLEGNPNELSGHPVYQAESRLKKKQSLVVIAVLSSGVEGVMNTLQALQDDNTRIETIMFSV